MFFTDIHGDISCRYDGPAPIYPFAFRAHAHDLGNICLFLIVVAFLENATIGYSLESLCVCVCVCVFAR